MFPRVKEKSLGIVGVALEGRDGSPIVVLKDSCTGRFLPLSVDPFDAEMLLRDYLDEDGDSSTAWLAELLRRYPPRVVCLETAEDGSSRVRLGYSRTRGVRDRFLPVGEGLVLCRKLNLRIRAEESLFDAAGEELAWMGAHGAFTGDFLYLASGQYASGSPFE